MLRLGHVNSTFLTVNVAESRYPCLAQSRNITKIRLFTVPSRLLGNM